eukprot:gene14164-16694_t
MNSLQVSSSPAAFTSSQEFLAEPRSNTEEIIIVDAASYNNNNNNNKTVAAQPSDIPKRSRLDYRWYTVDHANEFRLIIGAMFFKFAFESLSTALSTLVQDKHNFDPKTSTTFLAVMNIIYFIFQAIGSILVGPFVRIYRPSRVTFVTFLVMTATILFYLIIDVSTGGSVNTPKINGSWNKWIVIVVYAFMGISLGMVEVSRKMTPRQILGNDNVKLAKINGLVHVFYECAGTAGAFFSTFMVQKLGSVYALVHLPPCFLISAVCYFFISQPFPPAKVLVTGEKAEISRVMSVLNDIGGECYAFGANVGRGAKLVLSPKYWWLIPTYTFPQVLHRLLENLLFPSFAKKILGDSALSGIMTGGSNLGELTGALMVVKLSKYVKNPMWWVRFDGLFCTIVWVLAYPPSGNYTGLQIVAMLIPAWVVVSSSWAAGDISLLSFIQSTFPLSVSASDNTKPVHPTDTPEELKDKSEISDTESIEEIEDLSESEKTKAAAFVNKDDGELDEDNPQEGSPLASVIGFLFCAYAIIVSLVAFGFGKLIDFYIAQGDPSRGFFWVGGIFFTSVGVIAIITSIFARSSKFN